MGYRKITLAKEPCFAEKESEPIVQSVCDIEIKDTSETVGVYKKKRCFPISSGAVFISVCALSGLIFMFIPIPERVLDVLGEIVLFIVGQEDLSTPYFIPDTEVKSTIGSVFADIPARTGDESKNELPLYIGNESTLGAKSYFELANETDYSVDTQSLLSEANVMPRLNTASHQEDGAITVFSQGSPEVLIIHTHGTEGYSDSAHSNFRTKDTERNVVAAGKHLKKELEALGVSVIHCEEMFDKTSYIKAYSNSFAAVSEYLKKYPSIKYIIDLHRDAIADKNGKYLELITEHEGNELAQLMLVVGTDEAGARHPNWEANLKNAARIQKNMCEKYEGVMRPLNLRKASFNQQLSEGYFILEAGNCANTLSQVCDALSVFAESFVNTAKGSY